MSIINHPNFLRTVLGADAATCGATGLLLSFGKNALAALTGLPAGLLLAAGLALLPIAAFIAGTALQATLPRWAVWAIIIGNLGWVAASFGLLLAGPVSPTAFGYAFVAFQAIAVAILADLEYLGLRRMAAVSTSRA